MSGTTCVGLPSKSCFYRTVCSSGVVAVEEGRGWHSSYAAVCTLRQSNSASALADDTQQWSSVATIYHLNDSTAVDAHLLALARIPLQLTGPPPLSSTADGNSMMASAPGDVGCITKLQWAGPGLLAALSTQGEVVVVCTGICTYAQTQESEEDDDDYESNVDNDSGPRWRSCGCRDVATTCIVDSTHVRFTAVLAAKYRSVSCYTESYPSAGTGRPQRHEVEWAWPDVITLAATTLDDAVVVATGREHGCADIFEWRPLEEPSAAPIPVRQLLMGPDYLMRAVVVPRHSSAGGVSLAFIATDAGSASNEVPLHIAQPTLTLLGVDGKPLFPSLPTSSTSITTGVSTAEDGWLNEGLMGRRTPEAFAARLQSLVQSMPSLKYMATPLVSLDREPLVVVVSHVARITASSNDVSGTIHAALQPEVALISTDCKRALHDLHLPALRIYPWLTRRDDGSVEIGLWDNQRLLTLSVPSSAAKNEVRPCCSYAMERMEKEDGEEEEDVGVWMAGADWTASGTAVVAGGVPVEAEEEEEKGHVKHLEMPLVARPAPFLEPWTPAEHQGMATTAGPHASIEQPCPSTRAPPLSISCPSSSSVEEIRQVVRAELHHVMEPLNQRLSRLEQLLQQLVDVRH